MKKIYFSILSLLTVFTVNAQLTQANHAPANNDTYSMYQCDTVSPGPSGANALWNFSTITTHSSILTSYTAQAVTTTTYPAADIAVASGVNKLSYYNSTMSGLWYHGGNISVGSGGTAVVATLNYTAPAVYGAYPMSLNTTSTAPIGGTLNVTSPLQTTGTFSGSSTVLADGTGTLMLPGGASATFTNVIRVVTSQTINFSTGFASGSVVQNNYEYYQVGIKAPLFSISTSTATTPLGTNTQTFVNRNKDAMNSTPNPTLTVGLSENNLNTVNYSIYPNPASTSINFMTDSPDAKFVALYDITGKLVEKQSLVESKTKVDVSSYNKGLYFYTISSGNNKALKSGKITVGH